MQLQLLILFLICKDFIDIDCNARNFRNFLRIQNSLKGCVISFFRPDSVSAFQSSDSVLHCCSDFITDSECKQTKCNIFDFEFLSWEFGFRIELDTYIGKHRLSSNVRMDNRKLIEIVSSFTSDRDSESLVENVLYNFFLQFEIVL